MLARFGGSGIIPLPLGAAAWRRIRRTPSVARTIRSLIRRTAPPRRYETVGLRPTAAILGFGGRPSALADPRIASLASWTTARITRTGIPRTGVAAATSGIVRTTRRRPGRTRAITAGAGGRRTVVGYGVGPRAATARTTVRMLGSRPFEITPCLAPSRSGRRTLRAAALRALAQIFLRRAGPAAGTGIRVAQTAATRSGLARCTFRPAAIARLPIVARATIVRGFLSGGSCLGPALPRASLAALTRTGRAAVPRPAAGLRDAADRAGAGLSAGAARAGCHRHHRPPGLGSCRRPEPAPRAAERNRAGSKSCGAPPVGQWIRVGT